MRGDAVGQECGIENAGDPVSQPLGSAQRAIGEHDDRELPIEVTRHGSLESLPVAVVFDHPSPAQRVDFPPIAVVIERPLTIHVRIHRPHACEVCLRQQAVAVQRGIPAAEIKNRRIEAAIGSAVQCGRNPGLVL